MHGMRRELPNPFIDLIPRKRSTGKFLTAGEYLVAEIAGTTSFIGFR